MKKEMWYWAGGILVLSLIFFIATKKKDTDNVDTVGTIEAKLNSEIDNLPNISIDTKNGLKLRAKYAMALMNLADAKEYARIYLIASKGNIKKGDKDMEVYTKLLEKYKLV